MESKGRVLVVDDELWIREIIEMQLDSGGYNHISFTDPEQAMEFFRKNHQGLDLAVLDLTMPKVTGTEMAEEMCKLDCTVPIILISGYLKHNKVEPVNNIKKVLSKPIRKKELLDAVAEVLKL